MLKYMLPLKPEVVQLSYYGAASGLIGSETIRPDIAPYGHNCGIADLGGSPQGVAWHVSAWHSLAQELKCTVQSLK